MRTLARLRKISSVAVACAVAGCSRGAGPASTSTADAGAPAVDSAAAVAVDAGRAVDLARYREEAKVPAIACVSVDARGGAIELASGVAPETPLQAASIGKPLIAIAVMQLVEEGKLDLDAHVSPVVGFAVKHPRRPGKVTLRALLAHKAGIVDRPATVGRARDVPLADFVKGELAADDGWADAAPGAAYRYSNVGAALAAVAVERASRTPYDQRVAARIFRPLGMSRTSFDGAGAAPPHRREGARFVALPQASHAVYPTVDMRSTPRDLGRLARALLGGGELDGVRILRAESLAVLLDGELGFQRRTLGGRAVVGHEGEDAGASTGLYVDRARGVGAAVLANGDAFASGDPARARALERLVAELLER